MDYNKIYDRLIYKGKNRKLLTEDTKRLFETHHIIPKSWGGSNDSDNLVRLTLREHFLAHLLLIKIASTTHQLVTMLSAINIMINSNRYPIRNSRIYETLRINWKNNHPCSKQEVVDAIKKSLRDTRLKNGFSICLCACGCRQEVGLQKQPNTIKYIKGHKPEHTYRGGRRPLPRIYEQVECKCGCGGIVNMNINTMKPQYLHGHNPHNEQTNSQVSNTLTKYISNLTQDEVQERIKPMHNCDQQKRAQSIRQSKSSTLRITDTNGNEIIFNNTDDVKSITGFEYNTIRIRILHHGGVLSNGNIAEYIFKYTQNNQYPVMKNGRNYNSKATKKLTQ